MDQNRKGTTWTNKKCNKKNIYIIAKCFQMIFIVCPNEQDPDPVNMTESNLIVVLTEYLFILSLSVQTALLTLLRRDSFAASEKEIFQALCHWSRQNGEGRATQEVMAAVRLPLMSLTEMLNVVRPSGLLNPDDLLDAIKTRSESRDMDLNYRGMLSESVASGPVLVLGN